MTAQSRCLRRRLRDQLSLSGLYGADADGDNRLGARLRARLGLSFDPDAEKNAAMRERAGSFAPLWFPPDLR